MSNASLLAVAVQAKVLRQRDSTLTLDKLRDVRANADKSFLEALDEPEPKKRESFCNRLPIFVTYAATEL